MTLKGYEVLKAIINNGFIDVIANVIIGQDKNVIKDYSGEIIKICNQYELNYYYREESFYSESDYSIAISWRWIINSRNTKLIVLHDSLLPKYRGFSPLVNSLINGEKFIGVTAIFANEDFDRGDIIFQDRLEVNYPIKIEDAINSISMLYTNLVVQIINELKSNKFLESTKQNEQLASYSLWRDEEDYFIDWNRDAEYIKRFIDALSDPFKGAASKLNGETVRILDAELRNDVLIEDRDCGKILFIEEGFPIVVCGKGLVKITKLCDEVGNSILPLKKFRLKFKK